MKKETTSARNQWQSLGLSALAAGTAFGVMLGANYIQGRQAERRAVIEDVFSEDHAPSESFKAQEELYNQAWSNSQGQYIINEESDINIEDLYETLRRHEGLRKKAYSDSRGVRTIGMGFNLENKGAKERIEELGLNYTDVFSGKKKITKEQAYELMKEDVKSAIGDAERFIGKDFERLPSAVKSTLVNMAYNLGYPKLSKFEKLREEILERDYISASKEMVNSNWYNQTGRRARELTNIVRNVSN